MQSSRECSEAGALPQLVFERLQVFGELTHLTGRVVGAVTEYDTHRRSSGVFPLRSAQQWR
jgi:hypothetical protein